MLNNLIAGTTGANPEITNPILGDLGKQTGLGFFQKFIPAIIVFGLIIGVVVFFFILISGAIQWISSGGDKQALEGAKGKVTNAIIGLVILFATYAIIRLLGVFFNVELLNFTLPTLN